MRKRKSFARLGPDAQLPFWVSPDQVQLLLALLEPTSERIRVSARALTLLRGGLEDLLDRFASSLERLRELEKVCRANGFWQEDKGSRVALIIKNVPNGKHRKADGQIACGTVKQARRAARQLRGGLGK